MLVLSRRKDERIKIGDAVEVMVTDIQGDNVRLGITAPAGVKIVRDDAKRLSPPPARITEEATESPQVTLYVVPAGHKSNCGNPIAAGVYANYPGWHHLAPDETEIRGLSNPVNLGFIVNRTWLDQFARQFALVDHNLPEAGKCFMSLNFNPQDWPDVQEALMLAASRGTGGETEHDFVAICREYLAAHPKEEAT
jgi:carbon storage regulator